MMTSEPFWMVYGDGKSMPTIRHMNGEMAREEAKRLAAKHPGMRFYVLETIGCAQHVDVIYREIGSTGIQFGLMRQ